MNQTEFLYHKRKQKNKQEWLKCLKYPHFFPEGKINFWRQAIKLWFQTLITQSPTHPTQYLRHSCLPKVNEVRKFGLMTSVTKPRLLKSEEDQVHILTPTSFKIVLCRATASLNDKGLWVIFLWPSKSSKKNLERNLKSPHWLRAAGMPQGDLSSQEPAQRAGIDIFGRYWYFSRGSRPLSILDLIWTLNDWMFHCVLKTWRMNFSKMLKTQ